MTHSKLLNNMITDIVYQILIPIKSNAIEKERFSKTAKFDWQVYVVETLGKLIFLIQKSTRLKLSKKQECSIQLKHRLCKAFQAILTNKTYVYISLRKTFHVILTYTQDMVLINIIGFIYFPC